MTNSKLANLDVAIALFVYNREKRTRELLQSISQRQEVADIPVYIFADGANLEKEGDAVKVKAVREVCQTFPEYKLITQPHNIGLANSIVSGVGHVLGIHREIIVLEDDLELAPEFFDFMLTMLTRYQGHPKAFHISGYMIPTSAKLPDLGLYRLPGSWGWATWRDKWRHYQHDIDLLVERVRAQGISAFNVDDSFFHFHTLEENQCRSRETWAIRWYASLYLNGGLSVYPYKSFVRNQGFDGDGTNCIDSGKMFRVDLKHDRRFWTDCKLPNVETPSYLEAYKTFYRKLLAHWAGRPTVIQRLKSKFKSLIKTN